MTRPLRLEYPGALWHITNRGVERRAIFLDDRDRRTFLDLTSDVCREYRWRLHQYCEMTNHYHLLAQTMEPTLSRGMQQLQGDYADAFNRRHRRSGHLFKGRFDAQIVEEESYLLTVARYIVLNPVRAGMVATPAEWKWSSYRATAGLARTPAWLYTRAVLDRFDEWDSENACVLYRAFVNDPMESSRSPWEDLVAKMYLGSEEFIRRIEAITVEKEWRDEHWKSQRNVRAVGVDEVRDAVERHFRSGVQTVSWRSENARAAFALLARSEAIATLSVIGRTLHLSASAVSRLMDRSSRVRPCVLRQLFAFVVNAW